MPQLQWLGTIEKEDAGSYLAKALGEGIQGFTSGYMGAKQRQKEEAIQQSELDLKKKQIENDYSKLDYDKRKNVYDTMVKLLPSVPADKQAELTSSPEWTALEKSLGMPSLSGTTLSPEKTKPSWGQEQETASIKSDLMRGRGSISTLVGEPLEFIMKDEASALDYISKKGRNPAEFGAELSRYQTGAPTIGMKGKGKQTSPYKEYPDAFQEGGVWKVMRNGKKYKVQE